MAGGSAGSIFVDMILRDASFRGGLNNARNQTRGFANQATSDLGRARQAFVGVLSPIDNISNALGRMAGVFAGALSVQRIVQYSDTWRQLQGRLSLVAGDMETLGTTQQALFDIAQRTRQPLEGVYNLYTRLAQAVPEAQRAQYDLLGVTESINAALAITGEGSAQASSAILQFTQAVASGFKGSGQEINALLDSAPRLAQALQRAFGDGQTSLKELAKNGQLDLDTIFRALSGVGEEGRKLREEFAKLPPTVGQAFTQLNNAFLVFIGNSEAANEGTSALALGVQSLAKNLDTLATIATGLAAIFATRLIVAQGTLLAGWAANYIAVTRFTLGITSLGSAATLSAAGMTALAGASRLLGASLALVGGPVGAALLATFAGIYAITTQVDDAQKAHNETLERLQQINGELITASGSRRKELLAEKQALLDNAKAEIVRIQAQAVAAAAQRNAAPRGTLARFFKEGVVDSTLKNLEEASDRLGEITAQIEKLEGSGGGSGAGTGSVGGGALASRSQKLVDTQKELAALYEKNKTIITGLDQATFDYTQTIAELNELRNAGLLTEQQHIEAIANLDRSYKENAETVNEWGINVEEFGKQAANNIQDAFADFLFDPFSQGLDGMLLGFVKTLQRMLAEAAAANLAKALLGGAGSGAGLGGLLGGLFGSQGGLARSLTLGSGVQGPLPVSSFGGFFADGGNLPAGQWGIAGENGPEPIYGGTTGKTIYPNDMMGTGNGGNIYQIDARGADQGAVTRLESALLTLAGPGVIEKRVTNAQQRGVL